MKRFAFLIVFVSLFVAAGCQAPDRAPGGGYGDPYLAPLNDPQISVLDPELRQWLGFHPASITRGGADPMAVQVPVRNLAERGYLIDYRILFYDANGMEIEPVMGWKMVSLEPKQVVRLKANALGRNAEAYRLEVKWAK
jgi:uncharacterized protein YcfL